MERLVNVFRFLAKLVMLRATLRRKSNKDALLTYSRYSWAWGPQADQTLTVEGPKESGVIAQEFPTHNNPTVRICISIVEFY